MEVHFEDLKEEDLREVYDLCMETFQESFAFEEIEETFQLCRNDAHYRFLVGKSQGRSWRIPRSTFSTTCLTAAVPS